MVFNQDLGIVFIEVKNFKYEQIHRYSTDILIVFAFSFSLKRKLEKMLKMMKL